MRIIVLGTLTIAGALLGLQVASANQPGAAMRGAVQEETLVQPAQSKADCDELRRACLNKDKLGERGEGNCAKYRSECRGVRGYRPTERDN
jgi:hypothetical protein